MPLKHIKAPLKSLKAKVQDRYFQFLTIQQARRVTPKPYIEDIGIELASHCNLHCYSCDHFSQFSKSAYYDLAQFEKDIKRLYEIANGLVGGFTLLGGEPLLNKQCAEYFPIVRRFFPNAKICVITNGKLLPKQSARFWQSARENRIIINPTKYPIHIDWNEIKALCQKEQVELVFYNDEHAEKLSFKTQLDKDGRSDPFESFIHCHRANACTHMHNGRIYPCAVAANIGTFNDAFSQSLQQHPADFIDIHNDDTTYRGILEFLARPIPFCRYCKTKNMIYMPWHASKKTLDEYFD